MSAGSSRYPLRASNPRILEDQTHPPEQSRWNGNGQGATNGSSEYKASVRIVDGFPVEYSCLEDPRGNDFDEIDVGELVINFDYEMIAQVSSGAEERSAEESTRSLEWSLLWNVARNLGLHNCNYRKQSPEFPSRNLLMGHNDSYVVGLSSLAFDQIDDETGQCTILSEAVEEGVICVPMKGTMTANFTGDETKVKAYLESNIQQEMDSTRVRIENVKECRFVGDRNSFHAVDMLDSPTMNIGLVFGVLAGVLMLCFAFILARGRRRRRAMVLDDDTPLPSSIPAVIFEKRHDGAASAGIQSSGSGDTEESIPERIDTLEDDQQGAEPMPAVSNVAGEAQANVDWQQRDPDPELGYKDNENFTTVSHEQGDMPHVPPIFVVPVEAQTCPPKEPTKSKTLQTRRKRKKRKKKKPVLKRVSSKQSINEMETINEMDEVAGDATEVGSEFDGSEYSEYSTDDDDDGLCMTFTDSNWEGETSPKVSPSPVVPPSPIREEPKIRRLPPPWI